MFQPSPAPSLMDAAFALASTHQAALRREATEHATARRVRGSGDVPSLTVRMRTALARLTALTVPARASRAAEPCPTC